jgi:hypothetical protein
MRLTLGHGEILRLARDTTPCKVLLVADDSAIAPFDTRNPHERSDMRELYKKRLSPVVASLIQATRARYAWPLHLTG